MGRKAKSNGPTEQMFRLEEKIVKLGGEIPQPWPWAINKTRKRKGKIVMEVDLGLRNLQLLELKEDLESGKVKPTNPVKDTAAVTS
jgi:hypothetical protein